MTALINPNDLMHEHVLILRQYARQILIEEKPLTLMENDDREGRVQEFFAIGLSLGICPKKLTKMILQDLTTASSEGGR